MLSGLTMEKRRFARTTVMAVCVCAFVGAQKAGTPTTAGPSGPSVVRNSPGPSTPSGPRAAGAIAKKRSSKASAFSLASPRTRVGGRLRLAQGGLEMRIVSVAGLTRQYKRDRLPTFGWALRTYERESNEFMPSPGERPVDIDWIVRMVRSHVDRNSWEGEGARVFSSHARLIFVNKAATVTKAAEQVENLRRLIAPRLRVSTLVVEVNDEARFKTFGRLNASEARELYTTALRGTYGRVLSSGSTECQAGELVYLGSQRSKTLLNDFDVEVATDSKIADPKTNSIALANGIGVLPVVAPDGKGFAVFCQAANGELASLVNKAVGSGPIRHIEQASVNTMQSLFNFALEDSGGVFYAPSGGRRALVVIERLDEKPAADFVKGAVPVSLLSTPALAKIHAHIDAEGAEDDDDPTLLSIDEVVNIGRDAAGSEELEVDASQNVIFIAGKDQEVGIAKNAMRLLMSTMTRSYVAELRRESRPLATGGEWKPYGRPFVLSALGERSSSVRVGNERHVLRDYNVEIAQEAAISDPIIDRIFDGQLVTASFSTVDAQRCEIALNLVDNCVSELRDLPPAAEDSGTMTLPDQHRASLKRRIVATAGRDVHIGSGAPRSVGGEVHAIRWILRLN